ncbi:NAD(P)H-dependent FMN reductase [Paracoccus isoporae]|uniref:NAD(P)H-dependent FMN reductase n=1 Tax=Paracoccus isoporae TaxID=591205 RepID=A0A1G6U0W8_9RHOB|nr:NADPH-dependent FMN reductase [Paracoccus isoporae]SDD34989.1 NAD(P)H-dependent FMN reductase [Paracoccus isoporae]
MPSILGLSGSLREASYNSGLLRAAADAAPDGTTIQIGSIRDVPLYDGDLEKAEGLPAAVRRLQDQLDSADALLLVTPEYNKSIPGVFKNAIDWMSRGDGLKIFTGKQVALMGASISGFGTVLSQNAWLPVLRGLKMQVWAGGQLTVSRAAEKFSDDGSLTDDDTREQLRKFVADFSDSL